MKYSRFILAVFSVGCQTTHAGGPASGEALTGDKGPCVGKLVQGEPPGADRAKQVFEHIRNTLESYGFDVGAVALGFTVAAEGSVPKTPKMCHTLSPPMLLLPVDMLAEDGQRDPFYLPLVIAHEFSHYVTGLREGEALASKGALANDPKEAEIDYTGAFYALLAGYTWNADALGDHGTLLKKYELPNATVGHRQLRLVQAVQNATVLEAGYQVMLALFMSGDPDAAQKVALQLKALLKDFGAEGIRASAEHKRKLPEDQLHWADAYFLLQKARGLPDDYPGACTPVLAETSGLGAVTWGTAPTMSAGEQVKNLEKEIQAVIKELGGSRGLSPVVRLTTLACLHTVIKQWDEALKVLELVPKEVSAEDQQRHQEPISAIRHQISEGKANNKRRRRPSDGLEMERVKFKELPFSQPFSPLVLPLELSSPDQFQCPEGYRSVAPPINSKVLQIQVCWPQAGPVAHPDRRVVLLKMQYQAPGVEDLKWHYWGVTLEKFAANNQLPIDDWRRNCTTDGFTNIQKISSAASGERVFTGTCRGLNSAAAVLFEDKNSQKIVRVVAVQPYGEVEHE